MQEVNWRGSVDNRLIDVKSEGSDDLALALRLAWRNAPSQRASHYLVTRLKPGATHYDQSIVDEKGEHTLILLWHEERDAQVLPYPMGLEEMIYFVRGWLATADFGPQPDHDGHNEEGWRVFNEGWGHVAGHHYAIVAIQPSWAMYGK